jgi:phage gp36-like protein
MFATKADMIARFGEREVIALTDRDMNGTIDDAVIAAGLAAAEAEITGYLAGRYALPFNSVPAILVGYCCDIARYRLTGTEVTCTDDITARHADAMRYLRSVAKGEISLGIDQTGAPVGGVAATGTGVRKLAGNRRFNNETMSGY